MGCWGWDGVGWHGTLLTGSRKLKLTYVCVCVCVYLGWVPTIVIVAPIVVVVVVMDDVDRVVAGRKTTT